MITLSLSRTGDSIWESPLRRGSVVWRLINDVLETGRSTPSEGESP